jgi:hypothetical protein
MRIFGRNCSVGIGTRVVTASHICTLVRAIRTTPELAIYMYRLDESPLSMSCCLQSGSTRSHTREQLARKVLEESLQRFMAHKTW